MPEKTIKQAAKPRQANRRRKPPSLAVRGLSTLEDLRRQEVRLLRGFLNGEISRDDLRAATYLLATIAQTMRAIAETQAPARDADPFNLQGQSLFERIGSTPGQTTGFAFGGNIVLGSAKAEIIEENEAKQRLEEESK